MDLSDFEDLGIISDPEEDAEEEEDEELMMTPAMAAKACREGDGPHPPWEGHRDKLVGIVDMGRRAILI